MKIKKMKKFKSTQELINYAKKIEKTLSPQEKNVIAYHRKNLEFGATSPDGRPMTAFMVGPEILKGKHKGKIASVPGFVPGHNNNQPMSEDQARDYWAPEIEKGIWPIYDKKTANKRSGDVHTIMDADVFIGLKKSGNKKD
tara:strand:+ start:80 stop:502 length:423 start_codon:yes stop_codon:yes gene_type:complete